MATPLLNISPLDGRYAKQIDSLRNHLSEFALIKTRVEVEILWLISLGDNPKIKEVKKFNASVQKKLRSIIDQFTEKDAAEIKQIESITNHDVKAVEYWLKKTLKKQKDIAPYLEFIHFACTSEDINNLSYALMTKRAVNENILHGMNAVDRSIIWR